jgi:hypothetical protein
MRSVGRVLVLSYAAVFFLYGWQNTMAPDYAGPAIWNLVFAGLFWLGFAAVIQELAHLGRRHWQRIRSGAADARH